MKKRLIVLLLSVLFLAALCVGCGGEPADPAASGDSSAVVPVGTGGDEDACTVHQLAYHAIDGDWEKAIGKEKIDAFEKDREKEDYNIVSFVKFCGITREQYIEVMGMTDVLDEKLTRHHPDCPYTHREFVDAIFGDDPELSERIFDIDVFDDSSAVVPVGTGGDEDACTEHQFAYHAIDGDWEKAIGKEKMDAYIEAYSGKGEESNIVAFVKFCGITREQYIEVMGMTDVLDEKLTRHHPDCPYTHREFVDAIFGDDPELSERIFDIDVFDGL